VRYRLFLSTAFLFSGVSQLVTEGLGKTGLASVAPSVLLAGCVVAAALAAPGKSSAGRPLRWKDVWVGSVGGAGAALGTVAIIKASAVLPGYVVFAVASCGTMLLVAALGVAVFREKIGPFGLAGIAASTAAVVLLGG